MPEKRKSAIRFAVCVRNRGYRASLERNKICRVLPDAGAAEHGCVRVVDESGEDYLYPAPWFVVLDLPKAPKASILKAS